MTIRKSLGSGLLIAVFVPAFFLSCGNESRRNIRTPSVQACKIYLSQRDEHLAWEAAEAVLAQEPENTEARYCAVLAYLGRGFESWDAILGLLTSQLGAPREFKPSAIMDVKERIRPIIADIDFVVRKLDEHLYILAQYPDARITVEKFHLDAVHEVIRLLLAGRQDVSLSEISLEINGTWDSSHILLLGAFVNSVQFARDYLFAHNLILDFDDLPGTNTDDLSAEFARFFVRNPDVFTFDLITPDKGRISGDENFDGLRNQLLATVSYLSGRSSSVERAAPANEGLSKAIARQSRLGAKDAVIGWIDDGDGVPEKIVFPALTQLQLKIDGKLYDNPEFDNPLGQELWKALIVLAEDIRKNIEADKTTPVSLQPILQAVANKFLADDPQSTIRLLRKPVPDFLAINPKVFIERPLAFRDVLPYVFAFETTDASRVDMAVESEYYLSPNENYLEKLGKRAATGNDFTHFTFTGLPQSVSDYTVTSYEFFNDGLQPNELAPDGITATAKAPLLFYFSFPYPGLGGLLVPDANGFDGVASFPAPTNEGVNEAVNRFIQHYCLDLTRGTFDSVDESLYDSTNRIEDCSP